MKTFDPKCYELARCFLSEDRHILNLEEACMELASEIQRTIEDFILGREPESVDS